MTAVPAGWITVDEAMARLHELETVALDDLAAWHTAHPGLVATGRVALTGDDWPPIVLFADANRTRKTTNT